MASSAMATDSVAQPATAQGTEKSRGREQAEAAQNPNSAGMTIRPGGEEAATVPAAARASASGRRGDDSAGVATTVNGESTGGSDDDSDGPCCPFPPYREPEDGQEDDIPDSAIQLTHDPTALLDALHISPAASAAAPAVAEFASSSTASEAPSHPSSDGPQTPSDPSFSDTDGTLSPLSPPALLSPVAISDSDPCSPPPPPPSHLPPPYWTHSRASTLPQNTYTTTTTTTIANRHLPSPAAQSRLAAAAPASLRPALHQTQSQPSPASTSTATATAAAAPFHPHHRRATSSTSTLLQNHHLITLQDNETPDVGGDGAYGSPQTSPLGVPPRCWAKRVELADYVVVKGGQAGFGSRSGSRSLIGGRSSSSSSRNNNHGSGTSLGAFVVWTIRVETLEGGVILVHKRYSEFDGLRRRLVTSFPQATRAALPALPPKSLLNRFRPRFLEERRLGLQYFLNCILLNPEFSGSPVLREFLFS